MARVRLGFWDLGVHALLEVVVVLAALEQGLLVLFLARPLDFVEALAQVLSFYGVDDRRPAVGGVPQRQREVVELGHQRARGLLLALAAGRSARDLLAHRHLQRRAARRAAVVGRARQRLELVEALPERVVEALVAARGRDARDHEELAVLVLLGHRLLRLGPGVLQTGCVEAGVLRLEILQRLFQVLLLD